LSYSIRNPSPFERRSSRCDGMKGKIEMRYRHSRDR
jgi:hypothetical protein